jgi:hypothetical protein
MIDIAPAPGNEGPFELAPRPQKGTQFCQTGSFIAVPSGNPEALRGTLAEPGGGPTCSHDTSESCIYHSPTSTLVPTRIQNRGELGTALADVMDKGRRSANARRNLVIVRLACGRS